MYRRKIFSLLLAFLMMLVSIVPSPSVFADSQDITTLGDTAGGWPTVFSPYKMADGSMILDPAGDEHPIDVDVTSGVDRGKGALPSMYVATDETNLFVRLRLKGDPYDRKGGFLSSVWLVQIAAGGEHKATIGLNGKSPSTDYVYVANADGSVVQPIYATLTPGGNSVPGTNIVRAENGQSFLDFQVPIARIASIANLNLDETPVQLFFGTSKAANLSVINKEYMDTGSSNGSSVNFNGLASIYLKRQPLSISIDGGPSKSYSPSNKVMSGTSSLDSGQVSISINNGTPATATITNKTWSYTLPDNIVGTNGIYKATASVTSGENTATANQDVMVDGNTDTLTINGGAISSTSSTTPPVSGTFASTATRNNYKIYLYVSETSGSLGTEYTSTVGTGTWSVPSITLSNPTNNKIYYLTAKWIENGNGKLPFATTTQQLVYKQGVTINPITVAIGTITGNALPAISGTSSGADQIEVRIDGISTEFVTPGAGGAWSISALERPLMPTTHTITVIASNASGNTATATKTHTVTQTSITIDNGSSVTTNDSHPTLRGDTNAADGATVTVTISGVGTYTATVSNKRWAIEVPNGTTIADGTYTVTATVSGVSATQQLTINASTNVAISTPGDNSSTDDKTPTFSGTAEAGDTVALKLTTSEGSVIWLQNLTADSGSWTYTPTTDLAPDSYKINATAADSFGNEASVTNSFTVTADPVPVQTGKPAVTSPSPVREGDTSLTGTAEPGAVVTIKIGGDVIGTATADEDGSWTVPNLTLSEGDTPSITAKAEGKTDSEALVVTVLGPATSSINAFNAVSVSVFTGTSAATVQGLLGASVTATLANTNTVSVPVTWNLTGVDLNTAGSYTANGTLGLLPGGADNADNLQPTAAVIVLADLTATGSTGGAKTVTATGAVPGADVKLYDQNGQLVQSLTADLSGAVTFTNVPVGTGYYVTQTLGSLESQHSQSVDVVAADPVQTGKPAVTSPSPVREGDTSLTGTAEPGAVVTIKIGGDVVGTATADENGNWTVPNLTLSEGDTLSITAKAEGKTDSEALVVTVLGPATSTIQAFTPLTVHVNKGTSEATVRQLLGTMIQATLANQSTVSIPVTWSLTNVDLTTAGSYAAGGTLGQLPTAANNANNLQPSATVIVVEGLSITGSMDGAQTVTVTSAQPGATVKLYDKNGNVVQTATADANGKVIFTNVPIDVDYYATQVVNGNETGPSSRVSVFPKIQIRFSERDIWESVTKSVFLIDNLLGTVVQWTSSHPQVLTIADTPTQFPGITTQEYIVTAHRQEKDTSVILTARMMFEGRMVDRKFLLVVKGTHISTEKVTEISDNEIKLGDTPITAGIQVNRTTLTDSGNQSQLVDKLIITSAANLGAGDVSLYFDDTPAAGAQANEQAVEMSLEALRKLNGSLSVATPEGTFTLPQASVTQMTGNGLDLYFRIVPMRSDEMKQEVIDRTATAMQAEAGAGKTVQVLDIPREIETNYSGIDTDIILPLTKMNLTADQAANLRLYIEHTDGTKEVIVPGVNGQIINENGRPAGLKFRINRFSTFTFFMISEPAAPAFNGGGAPAVVVVPKADEPEAPTHMQYIYGYKDGLFHPEAAVTRAQMAAMLARNLSGGNVPLMTGNSYSDTAKSWARNEIEYAREKDIIRGYTNGKYGPNDSITRAQMAAIAMRWIDKQCAKDPENAPFCAAADANVAYKDVKVSHWAASDIIRISRLGIMGGYADGTFRPEEELTRAEAVKVLNRLFQRGPLEGVEQQTFPDVSDNYWAYKEIEEAGTNHAYEKKDSKEYLKP